MRNGSGFVEFYTTKSSNKKKIAKRKTETNQKIEIVTNKMKGW